MNVLIYNLKVVYFLLICSIESYIIPIQDIYSEEGKGSVKQIPKNIKHSKGYPYFESSRKLRRSRDVLDYEYNIFTPEFKVQSYQTKSYAYEEFIQNEEDELQLPRGFVEKNEIDIKNTINSPLQIIKHSQTQKMCAEEVKFTNDIAALFHQQIDIPRSIFPLCCKTLAPKIRTTECTTPLETKLTSETIPLHFSTQTSSSNKAPSTTPIEELSTALVALTTVTNTFIFVSSQAVLNIMLHVNCDDHGTSELSVFNPTEHKVTGQLSMKSTVQSHAQTTQTNCLDNSLNVALDTNQLSCLQEETVQKRTENNPFKYQDSSMKHKTIPSFEKASQNAMSTSNTKKMTTCQYIPISKKRKEMYTCDHLEITDKSDTEINSFQTLRSTKTIKEKKRTEHKVITKGSKHLKTAHHHALGPRPLQPKDITIKVSRFPLLSRQPKMPLFLCQISSNLCNRAHTVPLNCENTLKSTSSTSPEDIFKNIIPHFIKQMPTVPLLPAGGNIIKERFRTTEEREISQEITKSEIVTFTEPFNTGSKTSQITELENGDTSEDTLSYSEMFTETENVGDSSENKEVFGSSTPETINIFTAVGNISNNKYDNEEFTETGSIVFTENSESEQSGRIEYTPLTGPPLQITSLEEESSVSLREETDESTTSLKNIFDNNHSLEVRGSTDIPNEYLSTVISMGVELPISSSEETNEFTSMEEENESEPLTELENKTPSKEELDLSIPIEGIYRNETPVTIDVLSLLTEGTSKDLISTMSMSIAYSNVLGTGLTSAKENTETKTSVEVEESNTLTQEISESLASGSFQPSTTEETKHHLEHKSKSKPPTNIEEITQLRNETPESLSSEENMSRDSSTEESNGLTTETMSYIENEFETNPSYEMEQSTQLRKETSKTSDSLKSTAMTQLKSEITTNLKQETSEGSVSQSFESSASSTEETINNKKNKSESEPSTEIEESTEFREGTSETLRFMELISRASTTESSDGFTPLLENKSEAMTSVESEISTNLTRENSESSVSESFELSAPSTEETINYIENKSESEPSTEIEESTEFREGTSETLRFMELISRASSTESSDGFTPLLENKSVAMASVESEISTNLTPENSESSVTESFESSASSTEETINYIENKSESEPSTEIEESTEFREGTSETLRFMELISRASTTESSDGFTPLLENKSEAMTSVESEISTNLTPENSESSVSESFESSASSTEKTVNYIENKSKSEPSTEIEVSTKLKEETSETLSSRELISRASSTESPKVFTPIMENTSEAKTSVESEISTNLTQETSEGSVSESFESSASSTEETINSKRKEFESKPSTEIEEPTQLKEETPETLSSMEYISSVSSTEASNDVTPLIENKSEAIKSVESDKITNLIRETSEGSVSESFKSSAFSTKETINSKGKEFESKLSTEIEESTQLKEETSETLSSKEYMSMVSSIEAGTFSTENKSVSLTTAESEKLTILIQETSEPLPPVSLKSSVFSTEESKSLKRIENRFETKPSVKIEVSTPFQEETSQNLSSEEKVSTTGSSNVKTVLTSSMANKSVTITSVNAEKSTNLTQETLFSVLFESSVFSTEKSSSLKRIENRLESKPSTNIKVSTPLEKGTEILNSEESKSIVSFIVTENGLTPSIENKDGTITSADKEEATNSTQEISEALVSVLFKPSATSTEESKTIVENKFGPKPTVEVGELTQLRQGTLETFTSETNMSMIRPIETITGLTSSTENKSNTTTPAEIDGSTHLKQDTSEALLLVSFNSSPFSTEEPKGLNHTKNKLESKPSAEIERSTQLREEYTQALSSEYIVSAVSSTGKTDELASPLGINSANLTQETSETMFLKTLKFAISSTEEKNGLSMENMSKTYSTEERVSTHVTEQTFETLISEVDLSAITSTENPNNITPFMKNVTKPTTEREGFTPLSKEILKTLLSETSVTSLYSTEETNGSISSVINKSKSKPSEEIVISTHITNSIPEILPSKTHISFISSTEKLNTSPLSLEYRSETKPPNELDLTHVTEETAEIFLSKTLKSSTSLTEEINTLVPSMNYKSETKPSAETAVSTNLTQITSETLFSESFVSLVSLTGGRNGSTSFLENKSKTTSLSEKEGSTMLTEESSELSIFAVPSNKVTNRLTSPVDNKYDKVLTNIGGSTLLRVGTSEAFSSEAVVSTAFSSQKQNGLTSFKKNESETNPSAEINVSTPLREQSSKSLISETVMSALTSTQETNRLASSMVNKSETKTYTLTGVSTQTREKTSEGVVLETFISLVSSTKETQNFTPFVKNKYETKPSPEIKGFIPSTEKTLAIPFSEPMRSSVSFLEKVNSPMSSVMERSGERTADIKSSSYLTKEFPESLLTESMGHSVFSEEVSGSVTNIKKNSVELEKFTNSVKNTLNTKISEVNSVSMIEETNSLGFSQLQHSIHTFVEEFSENKKTETHPFLDHLSTPLTFQNITTTNRSVNTSIYEETNIYPKKTTIKQDKTNIIEIYQETRSPILEKSISVGNHTSPPINENIINATNNETQYPETSFKKLYWTENEHSSMTTNTFYSLTQDHESSKYSKILPNSELFNNESLLQYKTTNQIEETSNNKLKTVNPITSTIKTFKNEYIIDNFSTKSFSEVRTSVVDSTDLKFKEVLKSEHITEALETKTSTKENDEKLIQLKTTTEITSKTHVSEENYAESDRVKRIIDLGGGKLQFYSGNEWFVTDKSQIWIFDNSTSQAMNESFFRTSEDKTTNNFNENKRIIEELMDKPQTKDISEQMPFELFSQSILTTTNENEGNFSIKWGGMSLTNEDLVAIFNYNSISSKNISSYPPSSVDNWGYLQWNSIYNLQKRLNLLDKKCFSDRCEYKVDEDDGHSSTMIVYKNGSSSWKDTYIELRESLSNMRNINERTDFSKRVITMPYISNSESFESFMRNTFQQKTESKTKYDSYVWKNNIFNWHEILALQRMIDSTLSNINRIETSMNQLSWENYLEQFRRSKRINYSDRTVYKINYGLELKPLTIFKDGTTEFDNKRVTFSEMSERVKEMTPPQDSVQQSKEVQHVINLNSGKRQFYWNGRWFVTDNTHVWPFEDQTSSLMSDTFFNTPEDKSANKESIKRLLINNGMFESSFHTYEKMPFEIFTESVLRTSTYMKPNSIYQWGKTSLSLSDIIAMLRLSNFKSYKTQPSDYQWGETNWYSIYDRVKQAPQKTVNQIQEYNITDFDGSTNLLQVYKNGTSRYKNVLIDRTESLTSIQNLNTELDLSQNIINYPYNAQNVPFETFLNDVFDEKINKNTTYSSYTWRDYTFSWDMILAIYRVILYRYINNNEKGLSFSDIVLPILKSTKELYPNSTVLNVKYDGNTKPIIIFCNGRTLYDNEELDYKDMIKQLKDAKKSSGLVFRDDWESIRPTEILTGTTATMTEVKTKKITTYISKDGERITENAAVPHNYDWSLLDSEIADNKAHYPINLGATKVLFYMKGLWYITDGTNIWGFYDSLTIDCTTRLVKQMEQTFPDDPELTETAIQRLIDVKTEDDSEDLTVGLVMPFELIAQKFLFFYEHRKDMYIECKYDYKMYSIEGPEDVIAILRLAAYNDFATSHVELNWGEGRKVNWDWLVYELARSQKNKSRYSYTYKFQSGKFEETPDLIIYLNSSSSWKNQEISSNELYKKLTYVNMYQDFSVVQVNKEFKTDDDAFEIFIKKSLERRLNKKQTFSEYIWSDETFSWYELLTCIRYSDIFPNDLKGSAYWKTAIKTISTALSSNFSDKILYTFDTKEGREDIIVYMNESTLAKGIFLTEIQQYIDRYEDG